MRNLLFNSLIVFSAIIIGSCSEEQMDPPASSFTFLIKSDFLLEDQLGMLYITDETGKVVEAKPFKNDETLVFEDLKDFSPDHTYTMNYAQYSDNHRTLSLRTFGNVKPGSYGLSELSSYATLKASEKPIIGNHQLNIQLTTPYTPQGGVISEEGTITAEIRSNPYGLEAGLYQSPADIMYFVVDRLYGGNTTPRWVRFENAVAGEEVTMSYDDLTPMSYHQLDFPGAIMSYYTLFYVPEPDGYDKLLYMYQQDNPSVPEKLKLYYPDMDVPEFFTSMGYQTDFAYHVNVVLGAQPPSEFHILDAYFSKYKQTNKEISYSTSGDMTYLRLDGGATPENPNSTSGYTQTNWYIHSEGGSDRVIAIPEFPEELLNHFPYLATHNFDFKETTLVLVSGAADYDDWFEKRMEGDAMYKFFKELRYKSQFAN